VIDHAYLTDVLTFGRDAALVTTLSDLPGRPLEGRQSQCWVRLEVGWRIVHAHVSEVTPGH
jgi:endo-1,4-beta-mannosidase